MRRVAILVAGCLVGLGVLAAPAFATFHLEMVNEVMLASGSGDANVQFVELLDHGGTEEAFTPIFAPYRLAVYDGAGNKLGEQMLDPTGLRDAAAADKEYLLSTPAADTAFGVTGDAPLTVALPAGSGQACFEANSSPTAFSCLTWGAVTKPVETNSNGTGSVHGGAPPNGQSAQRQEDNSVASASPTPKAKNAAGSGGGGGGPQPFAGVGIVSGEAQVNRKGRTRIRLRCPAGSGGCTGRLTLTTGKKAKRIARTQFTLKEGRTSNVKVTLSRAGRSKLARTGVLPVRAVVLAHDSKGQEKRTSAKFELVATSG